MMGTDATEATPAHVDVALWVSRPNEIDETELAACLELLDPEERARHERFRFPHLRRDYAVSHALLRRALSAHVEGVAPEEWRYGRNDYGRPHIVTPAGVAVPSFNLSHTAGCIVVALCAEAEVGVDVERVDPARDLLELAPRYFAPQETEALRALPWAGQVDRFFTLWTLKEAYIKARGMGLALPLNGFAFSFGPRPPTAGDSVSEALEREITIAFDGIDDDPAAWSFRSFRLGDAHPVAVATRAGARAPVIEVRNHVGELRRG